VRSKVHGSDFDRGAEALSRIRAVVDRVNPAGFDPGIRVGYSGDLQTAVSEYQAVNEDLTDVGLLGCLLIGGVVLLYYLRLRTVVIMLLTIGVGVAWTFGATELAVGHLNVATGFLFTIVAGNGINFGIMFMARYLEARRKGIALEEAVGIARRETWVPTLTAGCAAAAAYGSLAATDFRGFHDFGLIGGAGMLLCWIATFAVLPSLLAVSEWIIPLDKDFGGPLSKLSRQTDKGIAFGRPFEWLVARAPRTIVVGGVAATLLGAAAAVLWVRADPMEYDLRNLRTDVQSRAEEIRLNILGDDVTGHVGAAGMAILVDRPEQVPALRKVLEARRDAAPAGQKPFERLHALQDFVPPGQDEKIPVLLKIRQRLVRAHERGAIEEADWRHIEQVLPPADLTAFGMKELPEGVARAFTEGDGTRGRIVYISPAASASVDDAHYLFRWADSYREAPLPDGSLVRGSGRAVIYADMWESVVEDVPLAVLLSFAATVLVVLLAFRGGRSSLAVLLSLLVGVAWMVGVLVVMKVKLNFLNFIALPITFGIGVDYAVNVVQRYAREGRGSALLSIRETGGAVILCSLTTTLGYLALVRSTNFAVRSLGVAAFIGEVCCLLASVLVLPAALLWLDQRRSMILRP
ncbi:MAG: efflux RND transporter permease subunit, partial [Myxococcaceae bacterium]